jgi:hypothetical protein
MFLPYSTTEQVGDYMLAGKHHGKIKAMHDEENIFYCCGSFDSGFSSWS